MFFKVQVIYQGQSYDMKLVMEGKVTKAFPLPLLTTVTNVTTS
jgi:hypothetical protein